MSTPRGDELLRSQLAATTQKLRELESRYQPVEFVRGVLSAFASEEDVASSEAEKLPVASPLHPIVAAPAHPGSMVALPMSTQAHLDDLWLGRVAEAEIDVNGVRGQLTLDPAQLKDGRPLPILECGGARYAVLLNVRKRLHMRCSTYQQRMPGITFEAFEMFEAGTEAIVFLGSAHLEKAVARWAQREPRAVPGANLMVYCDKVKGFAWHMLQNRDAVCHFTCHGGTGGVVHAQLILTSSDGLREIAQLPIGTA